eukprot:7130789-Pyramimonas_sp.AAC.1
MIGLFLQAMSRLRKEFGGQLAVSFEWPRCCGGWGPNKNSTAKQLKERTPRVIDFDGCAFDLKAKKGARVEKPWG